MSDHQGVITAEMKAKITKVAGNRPQQVWEGAQKKNKDDRNTELTGKFYFAAQAIADALEVGVTPVGEFDKAAKALPDLIKKSQAAAAAVKPSGGKEEAKDDEPAGKVVYANTAVKKACTDSKTQTKIELILSMGAGLHRNLDALQLARGTRARRQQNRRRVQMGRQEPQDRGVRHQAGEKQHPGRRRLFSYNSGAGGLRVVKTRTRPGLRPGPARGREAP